MAEFRGCIVEALANGEIDKETADLATATYEDAYSVASETLGPVDADRAAGEAAMRKLEAEAIEARRRRQLSVRTRRAALETMAGLKERRGYTGVVALGGGDGSGKPPRGGWVQGGTPPEKGKPYSKGAVAAMALKRLVENRPGLSGAPGASVEGRYRAVRGKFDAMMADLIEKFETKTGFDAPGRAHMDNVVREAFGEDTGDQAAKALAQAWDGTAETARHMFNAAGGAIGKLDGWGLPQMHDPLAVRRAGKDQWVAAITPLLDRTKMIDSVTKQPFTDKRLAAVLGEVWETIGSGGANKGAPGERIGKGALAAQRAEQRFLTFQSADAWMTYQRKFGEGDAFQAMMGHLDDMARDVAQMQILGPNPRHQFEWLAAFARREAALEELNGVEGAKARAEGMVGEAERMMAHFTGDLNMPVNPGLSNVGGGIRSTLTGTMLGSAVLGEIGSGVVFGRMARGFTGLSRNGDMGELVRLLADPAERAIARRTGFIIEQATDGFVRGSHDNLRLMTVGAKAEGKLNAFARRLPAATIRLQGLTGLVAARKRSFRFELMGALHDAKDRSLADLAKGDKRDQTLARWLDARGFTEADWTIMRAAPVFEPRPGATFLKPEDIAQPELGLRLAEAIDMETRLVSPETTLETRAMWITARPGSFWGELQRSTSMFKGFTATLTSLYAQEMALQARAMGGNAFANLAGMAAGAVAFMTVGGAINIQLREMAKGNDPRPMDDPKFWGAALAQGGGLGMAGDFFYAAQARNGKTAPVAAFGPVGQLASDAWGLTGGNALELTNSLLDGEDLGEAAAGTNAGREGAKAIANYNPLSSLWWSRAAFSRLVADNLQRALDPEAEEAFQRRARRMEKETGQGQWWPQGSNAPDRAPDLSNMGGRQE
ncbi:hypothetical protein HNP47_000089 [Brevundimonas vesicularis]|uniref:Uncharacterized protein n=1 Tax=Brevundimonas vesicularis TaxID=41276 RepID=A0A7W9FRB6_BREVE|nr:hypothetical protein [Brevundimonas vesicularis]MBB5770120.1 hypothetical protein [Brevundimonas vesicularis]